VFPEPGCTLSRAENFLDPTGIRTSDRRVRILKGKFSQGLRSENLDSNRFMHI